MQARRLGKEPNPAVTPAVHQPDNLAGSCNVVKLDRRKVYPFHPAVRKHDRHAICLHLAEQGKVVGAVKKEYPIHIFVRQAFHFNRFALPAVLVAYHKNRIAIPVSAVDKGAQDRRIEIVRYVGK